jgi:fatty-acid desaturase
MTEDAKIPAWTPGPASTTNPPDQNAALTSTPSRHLARPESVTGAKIRWIYAIPIVVLHLLALLACIPWLFTWVGLIALLVGVPFFGQGVNLCYHRLLTHRSFRVPVWFEHLLVILALCSLEDTPICWVTTHRSHHTNSDVQPDPHSPLVNFLWGHMGWLIYNNRLTRSIAAYEKYAADLVSDRFYRRLEANVWISPAIYLTHAILLTAAAVGLGAITGGPAGALRTGLSMLVWGVILRTVMVWHITWSVNSVTHLFGYRTYDTPDNSRNNWLVGLLGAGEGWHNNHHHDPTSATVQHRWWEIDPTYYVIKLLAWVGLAKNVVPPRAKRQAIAKARIGDA